MSINQKLNWNKSNNARRSLRLETLENREMLSATPIDSATIANETAAIVAAADFSNAVVDLGDVDASTGDLTFAPTESSSQYTMSWNAIEDAASYNVKISRDGGQTWITYFKTADADDPTAPSCLVKGVYVGNTYSYKVFGVNESGKLFGDALEGTFASFKLVSAAESYVAGDTINVSLNGSDDASASIKWYNVTDDGDVEIADAAGLLSYAPTSGDYPIKVVATGTGCSEGVSSEVTIVASGDVADASYDAETRLLTLDWDDVEDAAIYRVLISRDGGQTWVTYAKPTDSTVTITGIYVGKSYSYQILAYNNAEKLNATTLISSGAGTFAPVSLAVDVAEFKVGDTINATVKGADNASSTIAWYYVTDDGDVEITEAAGLYSYAPTSAENDIKVVLTGTGVSKGTGGEAVVAAHVNLLGEGKFGDYSTLNRRIDLTWNVVEDAVSYRFLKASDSSASTWKKAATIVVENGAVTSGNAVMSADGSELTYSIGMFNVGDPGLYRVVAVDANGWTVETQDFSFTNFGLQLDHDAYNTNGDTLVASTTPTTSVSYQWYSSSDTGATWTEISGATSASYTISSSDAALQSLFKVVATSDTGETAVAYASPKTLNSPLDLAITVDEDNVLNMTFTPYGEATDYQVEYYYTDGAYPVWLNMTSVTYTETRGKIVATHVNGSNYENYDIRVRAVGEGVLSGWNVVSEGYSTAVTLADDIVDPLDGQTSLREAVMHFQELGDQADPITFPSGISTFYLDSPLEITGDVTIEAESSSHVTIDSRGTHGAFVVEGDDASLTISNLNLVNGEAEQGSGVYVGENASVVVTACSFTNNDHTEDTNDNGVLYGAPGSSIKVESSIFNGNDDMAVNAYGDMELSECSVINNDHGVHFRGTNGKIVNAILWNNTDCNLIVFGGSVLEVSHTLSVDNTIGAKGYNENVDGLGGAGTLKATSLWLASQYATSPLNSNTGRIRSTSRISVTKYDYNERTGRTTTSSTRVRPVDSGDNSAVTTAYDAAGNVRRVNYNNGQSGGTVDLGAYEYNSHAYTSNAIADLFAEGFFEEF